MNERIKLLIEQATTYIDPIANDGVCWDFDKEKFAELIVRQCADIADSIGEHGYIASEEMLEQFGVK